MNNYLLVRKDRLEDLTPEELRGQLLGRLRERRLRDAVADAMDLDQGPAVAAGGIRWTKRADGYYWGMATLASLGYMYGDLAPATAPVEALEPPIGSLVRFESATAFRTARPCPEQWYMTDHSGDDGYWDWDVLLTKYGDPLEVTP